MKHPKTAPADISDRFYQPILPDYLLEQFLQVLDGDIGMVEGNAVRTVLLDLKRLKFLCKGIANAYILGDKAQHKLHEYLQILMVVLNVRTTEDSVKQTGNVEEKPTSS